MILVFVRSRTYQLDRKENSSVDGWLNAYGQYTVRASFPPHALTVKKHYKIIIIKFLFIFILLPRLSGQWGQNQIQSAVLLLLQPVQPAATAARPSYVFLQWSASIWGTNVVWIIQKMEEVLQTGTIFIQSVHVLALDSASFSVYTRIEVRSKSNQALKNFFAFAFVVLASKQICNGGVSRVCVHALSSTTAVLIILRASLFVIASSSLHCS